MPTLEKKPWPQFNGLNTVLDSTQAEGSAARECTNFLLRPIGGLGVPAAWTSFAPGGVALDLGFLNNIDFLFDGAPLLIQDPDGNWWDVSAQEDGTPRNVVVTAPSTPRLTDLLVAEGLVLAFKLGPTTYIQLGADDASAGWFMERLPTVTKCTTRYTAPLAFGGGAGIVFANRWKLAADPERGLIAGPVS